MKWYNKFNKKSRGGSLNCPSCNHHFEERIIYIIEPNTCPKCAHEIGFIDISPYHPVIYTIDLDSCPELITVIFNHLKTKNHKEGYDQLKEFVLMVTSNDSNEEILFSNV